MPLSYLEFLWTLKIAIKPREVLVGSVNAFVSISKGDFYCWKTHPKTPWKARRFLHLFILLLKPYCFHSRLNAILSYDSWALFKTTPCSEQSFKSEASYFTALSRTHPLLEWGSLEKGRKKDFLRQYLRKERARWACGPVFIQLVAIRGMNGVALRYC